jgi:hypothetical protein
MPSELNSIDFVGLIDPGRRPEVDCDSSRIAETASEHRNASKNSFH